MQEITLVIGSSVELIYDDDAADVLGEIGYVSIRRASHVEPVEGGWAADMAPVGGPVLATCKLRSEAIAAEVAWLKANRGL